MFTVQLLKPGTCKKIIQSQPFFENKRFKDFCEQNKNIKKLRAVSWKVRYLISSKDFKIA